MVTFSPFSVAEMQQVAEVKFAGSGDNVRTRMEIQFGRGPFAAPLEGLTKIGDELTVVIYVEDGGAGYDMMVKNCYAYDSRNFKSANKIRLLNDHGCLFRPHQMEYFQRTFDTGSSGADLIGYARMNAFKFPDKMDVFLSCELELCKGGCDTHCEMDDYPIDITESVGQARSRELPETEAVPVTTFRPEVRKVLKGVKRLRKPKDFSPNRVRDDAVNVLNPPDLSPELLQLLEELGADSTESLASIALPQKTERPITEGMVASPSTLVYSHSESTPLHVDETEASLTVDEGDTDKSKMSFSTIFAGTHTVSDTLPPTIINNDANFKPSQLLSASMDSSEPFQEAISSFSKGASGNNLFPPRLPTDANNKLTNVLEQATGLEGPFFQLNEQFTNFPANGNTNNNVPTANFNNNANTNNINANNNNNVVNNANSISNNVNNNNVINNNNINNGNNNIINSNSNMANINNEISIVNDNIDTLGFNINTLQQQLQSEGFNCRAGSTDPKCKPQSNLIRGGFQPVQSTTPNIFSTTLVFTSPRSVELLQQKLANNPNVPKQVVMKVVEAPRGTRAGFRPPRNLKNNPRYGARLEYNRKRFANILGHRRRRGVENVFADHDFPRETVNMIKNFQVVSASDLAFDTSSLKHMQQLTELDYESEICFEETAFYSGLLVTCSLLLLSGLVSICSIKRVRKYQTDRNKKIFFGSEVLDSYQ